MSYRIVVSRFNENIEWTKQLNHVIIYNKSNIPEANQIMLPNVGREGHTYFTYICDHYDSLEDYTIFLQGNPFDHSPNLINNLNNFLTNPSSIGFEYLSETIYWSNISVCKFDVNLPLIDIYETIFHERQTDMFFSFGRGAQFIVSKKNILKRPKSFYMKIVELLQKSVDPMEGYAIERFHRLIFE